MQYLNQKGSLRTATLRSATIRSFLFALVLVLGCSAWEQSSGATARVISITNAPLARGSTNCFSVLIESQGDENSIGFSIQFDADLLSFVSAQRGADIQAAPQFLVNTGLVAQGRVGLGFLLPQDTALSMGSRRLIDLFFAAKPGSNTVSTSIRFIDAPTPIDLSDPLANALEASFLDREDDVVLTGDSGFVFNQITRQSDGVVSLHLSGPAGTWELSGSTNMVDWVPLLLTNSLGQLDFLDAATTNLSQRFYKAVKQ